MEGHIAERGSDPPVRPAIQRYAAAVAWVGIGLLSALWVQGVMDVTVPLLISVLMAAWFNGLWPALLASFLAVVADDYFFTPPLYTLTPELSHVPHLTAFVLLAVFFATMSASRRRAEYLLKRARNEMEARVVERTAELRESNVQLQAEIVERQRAEQALEEQHSHASLGQVHVTGAADGIHLTVQDSGKGFDAASGRESHGGLGFVSMRERLRVLHGTVRVESAPSQGTRIDVWIPATSLEAGALAEDDGGPAYSRVIPS